jgi:hypothetical protein
VEVDEGKCIQVCKYNERLSTKENEGKCEIERTLLGNILERKKGSSRFGLSCPLEYIPHLSRHPALFVLSLICYVRMDIS